MCRRDQSSFWWCLALFSLVLLFSARTAWGQEPSEPSMTPLSLSETPWPLPWTQNWEAFDQLWSELQAELIASAEDSARLLTQLQELQIELDALRSSLAQSATLLESSRESLERERVALVAALAERNRALAWAKALGGIAAGSTIILLITLIR